MDEQRSRGRGLAAGLLALVAVFLAGLAAFAVFTLPQFDVDPSFAVTPDRVTVGALVVATLLVVAAIALPAVLLSRWRSEREALARDRRQ